MISPNIRGQNASKVEWAPVGTTWHYEYESSGNQEFINGYSRVESVRDTMIALSLEEGDTNLTAHILEETYYGPDGIWDSPVMKHGLVQLVYLTYEWQNQVWL